MFLQQVFLLKCLTFCLTIVFICSLPLICVIVIPILVYRRIVFHLARIFKPKMGKMLAGMSGYMAGDGPYERPRNNLISYARFDGDLTMEVFQKNFRDNIIELRKSGGKNELVFPELRQYQTEWLGYLFWTNDENFSEANHFVEVPDSLNGGNFNELKKLALEEPFESHRPLWKVYRMRDHSKNTTYFLMRFHHSLMDGYSTLKCIALKFFQIKKELLSRPTEVKSQPCEDFLRLLSFPFVAPYELVRNTIISRYATGFQWPMAKGLEARKISVGESSNIPMDKVKGIAKSQNVCVSSIVLSAIAGGLRRYMGQNSIKIPTQFLSFVTVPVPGHPDDKLRNHASSCQIYFPTGVEDPLTRLQIMNTQIGEMKRSTQPLTFYFLMCIWGYMPIKIVKFLVNFNFVRTPSQFSCVPGAKQKLQLKGMDVLEYGFALGFTNVNFPIIFNSISFNGYLRYLAVVDRGLIPSEKKAEELMNCVAREIDELWTLSE